MRAAHVHGTSTARPTMDAMNDWLLACTARLSRVASAWAERLRLAMHARSSQGRTATILVGGGCQQTPRAEWLEQSDTSILISLPAGCLDHMTETIRLPHPGPPATFMVMPSSRLPSTRLSVAVTLSTVRSATRAALVARMTGHLQGAHSTGARPGSGTRVPGSGLS